MNNETNDRLNKEEMDLIMNGLDCLIEYLESLDDDKFRSFEQLYSEIFETREGFAKYELESMVGEYMEKVDYLERCLELS